MKKQNKQHAAYVLAAVREVVLTLRVNGYSVIGLSHLERLVAVKCLNRFRTISSKHKITRGEIQRALALLAIERVMYSRTRPEPGVASYEHCETDKRFRVRWTEKQAAEELKRLGISVFEYSMGSWHWTPSLGANTRHRVLRKC